MNSQSEKQPNWCLEQYPIKRAIDEYGKRLCIREIKQMIRQEKTLVASVRQLITRIESEGMSLDDVRMKLCSIAQFSENEIASMQTHIMSIEETLPENYD